MSQLSERLACDARSLQELVESEHRHRKLVESLPDAIVVHTDGKIAFANPFALWLHKASSADQLLGREIRRLHRTTVFWPDNATHSTLL